jgi:hypothetical protein
MPRHYTPRVKPDPPCLRHRTKPAILPTRADAGTLKLLESSLALWTAS